RKGPHVSSAAPTPTSRWDQPGRRAGIAPAAFELSRLCSTALPDTVSPLVVASGRGQLSTRARCSQLLSPALVDRSYLPDWSSGLTHASSKRAPDDRSPGRSRAPSAETQDADGSHPLGREAPSRPAVTGPEDPTVARAEGDLAGACRDGPGVEIEGERFRKAAGARLE